MDDLKTNHTRFGFTDKLKSYKLLYLQAHRSQKKVIDLTCLTPQAYASKF